MSEKSLNITDFRGAEKNISDIEKFGNPDLFRLIAKASSKEQGWMKSTKAMEVVTAGGCIVQVSTQQRNPDGSYALAEAVCFVPDCKIHEMADGSREL